MFGGQGSIRRLSNTYVQRCEGCRLVSLPERPEPMQRRQLPSNPWIDVAIDYLGPMPSGEYLLVIIDYYSRYKEVEIMTRITAKDTISRLDRIFTRLGYPVTITLDNARQFASDAANEYTVVDKKGSRVTVEDSTSGKTYQRNSSHLKKVIKATEVPKEQQLTENYVRRHMDTMLPQTEQKQLRFYPGLPDTFRDFTM